MTLDCSPAIKALWGVWFVLPFAAMFVIARLVPAGTPLMQESMIVFRFMGAIGGCWMLVGLGIVPLLGAQGRSLTTALGLVVGWSAVSGLFLGPGVAELKYRPPASAVGEPVEFAPNGVNRGVLMLRPTSGAAASARFRLPPVDSVDAYARAGNKPVKGKVYKGGRDLWYARLD
jgi:hypothetical protein